MDDTDPAASALSAIRMDIEETVAVYNLDGAGKNSYPISAAMVRHARSLLAAVEAPLSLAEELTGDAAPSSALEEDRAWVRAACAARFRSAITVALTGQEAGDEKAGA